MVLYEGRSFPFFHGTTGMFHEKQTAGSSDESDSIVAERHTEHEIFYIYFNNIYSGLKRY